MFLVSEILFLIFTQGSLVSNHHGRGCVAVVASAVVTLNVNIFQCISKTFQSNLGYVWTDGLESN